MTRGPIAVLLSMVLAAAAQGAPHKVLVLPVDGTADAATRAKLTAQIVKLARVLDGQVAAAEATFADTALAVGCDPRAATCSEQVIAMLGVEELIWGTASLDGRQTRLVVRRAGRGRAPREVSTVVAVTDSNEQIAAAIAPLFGAPGASTGSMGSTVSAEASRLPGGEPAPAAASEPRTQTRTPPTPLAFGGGDGTAGIARGAADRHGNDERVRACGGIDCGDQACRIECSGALSCPAIRCADSCRCDVRCGNPSTAYPSISCPQFPGTVCTRNGAAGAPCDSTFDNVCDTCP